jgi:integrase
MPSAGIVMLSTSSLTGIALSPVWNSIGSWSYGTGAIWNPGNWLQELSTSAWALCGGSSTKLPIAACSVRISRLAFAASKGVKKLGVRLGNWLTVEQAHSLWQAPDRQGLKGKRDRALLALLLACGLRRHEAVGLRIDDLQQREEHWAIVDLVGKAGHVRTVPIPDWVKGQLDEWLRAAGIARGRIFRRVTRMGRTWGDCMTEKSIWHIVKDCAKGIGMPKLAPHDLRRTCARLCHAAGGELEQIQFLLGHVSVKTTERYLGCKQRIRSAVNDRIGIEPNP